MVLKSANPALTKNTFAFFAKVASSGQAMTIKGKVNKTRIHDPLSVR